MNPIVIHTESFNGHTAKKPFNINLLLIIVNGNGMAGIGAKAIGQKRTTDNWMP